jgi:hypothetical protein
MFVQRCVACGYDGALLRQGRAPRCAQCGCDLRERPARSYAEMEGLVGRPLILGPSYVPARRLDDGARSMQRAIQRWIAFLFFVLVGLTLLVGLIAAALP